MLLRTLRNRVTNVLPTLCQEICVKSPCRRISLLESLSNSRRLLRELKNGRRNCSKIVAAISAKVSQKKKTAKTVTPNIGKMDSAISAKVSQKKKNRYHCRVKFRKKRTPRNRVTNFLPTATQPPNPIENRIKKVLENVLKSCCRELCEIESPTFFPSQPRL